METMRINKWLKDLIEEFREENIKSNERDILIFQNDKTVTKEENERIIKEIKIKNEEIKKMNEIDLIQRALVYQIYDMKERKENE